MYILRNKMTVYDNPVFFRRGCAIVNSEKWSETETTEREILQEMKYQNIIENMTLKEKAAFLSGKSEWQTREFPRLDIPAIFCSDGPNGVRKQAGAGDHLGINPSVPATCFPTAATMANSWDEALGEKIGEALAEEAVTMGVNVILGPGLNIKRSPLCGRNFEYFSEDPYHAGKMAAAYVRGIQSSFVFRSKGKIWYQAFWYLIAFCIVTCIVNSINWEVDTLTNEHCDHVCTEIRKTAMCRIISDNIPLKCLTE